MKNFLENTWIIITAAFIVCVVLTGMVMVTIGCIGLKVSKWTFEKGQIMRDWGMTR